MDVPAGSGPSRRVFLGLLVGGAAIGVTTGYAINRGTAIHNPAAADLARMMVYFATFGEVYALHADTGTVRWARPLITSEVLAVGNGGVYAASQSGQLYALDAATGSIKWSDQFNEELGSPFPSVSGDIVYIAPGGGYTYAFDAATGHQRWRHQTTSDSISDGQSPVVYRGIVYVGCPDSYVYALDAVSGEFRWRFGKGGQAGTGLFIVAQDILFADGYDHLYALDPKNGKVQGIYPPALPCINGIAYTGSTDGSLQARDFVKSEVLWTRRVKNVQWSPATIAGNLLYLGANNMALDGSGNIRGDWIGSVIALDAATGRSIWSYKTPEPISAVPVIAAGIVYAIGQWNLYALDAVTGETRWIYTTSEGRIGPTLAVSLLCPQIGPCSDTYIRFQGLSRFSLPPAARRSWRPQTPIGRRFPGQARRKPGSPHHLLLGFRRRGCRFKSGRPTKKTAGHRASGDLPFAFHLFRCPILGARRERTGLLAGRIPASRRVSSGTADTGESAAR